MESNAQQQNGHSDTAFEDFLASLPKEPAVGCKPTKKKTPRVPVEHPHGININFCKNPNCSNFGVPIEGTAQKGVGAVKHYTVVANGKNLPAGRCNSCGETFPLKSNNGVFEETWRIAGQTFGEPSCPDQACENHRVGVSTKKAYFSLGLTKTGSQRYRCRQCEKIFSVKDASRDPAARHKLADKSRLIMELLVNKMPQRRIVEVARVSAPVF